MQGRIGEMGSVTTGINISVELKRTSETTILPIYNIDILVVRHGRGVN